MKDKRIRHVGIRVSPEAHGKLRYIAEYEGHSINEQVYKLIRSCIRQFEKEHGPISPEDLRR